MSCWCLCKPSSSSYFFSLNSCFLAKFKTRIKPLNVALQNFQFSFEWLCKTPGFHAQIQHTYVQVLKLSFGLLQTTLYNKLHVHVDALTGVISLDIYCSDGFVAYCLCPIPFCLPYRGSCVYISRSYFVEVSASQKRNHIVSVL